MTKLFCVSTNDPRYLHTTDIENIEDHYRSEIAHFFQVYKELEGKKVEIIGWKSAKDAKTVVIESIKKIQRYFEKILEKCKKIVNIFYKKKKTFLLNTKKCEECEKEYLPTVALRMCLTCGHVGCCDSSIGKHATKTF